MQIDDYKIIRFRDDYRIYTNDEKKLTIILKALTEVLLNLNMKLNEKKTKITSDIIANSMKEDKYKYLGIDEDYDDVNESMYFDNLKDVKNYCDDIVCLYSDNDPYVKYEAEKEFANTITENQVMISGGGHLNSESGYTEFFELLKYL